MPKSQAVKPENKHSLCKYSLKEKRVNQPLSLQFPVVYFILEEYTNERTMPARY